MFPAAVFGLIVSTLAPVFAVQVPLGSSLHWQDGKKQTILGDEDLTGWNLNELPNPNGTDHLVFETVHSLLQHWPNTRMRNGHNIVPGVIPKGTLLYHGGESNELPPGPEWVAMDPEHSHLYCVDHIVQFRRTCWHLTFATTRPLKVVYFDGNSAAKMPYGTLDTQDLVAWGRFGTGYQNEESKRIQDLCQWGRKFDIDAIVRMEVDFEVMICDFTSGLRMVSFAKIASRGAIHPMQPGFVTYEAMNAGSWHNHFPGETRVQLDLAGLVSLYDTQLVPSLIPVRTGQERWDHRVRNISSEDILAVKSRLEGILIRPSGLSSSNGVDWKTLFQVIVDRFAGRLELTRHFLNSTATNPKEILDLANKTQIQLRVMLTPYLLSSAIPTDPSDDLGWIKPVYKLCATTHTYTMGSELDSMTDSEKLLLLAARGTSREICRVVTKMWAAGVYAGIDPSLNTKESPDIAEVTQVWDIWVEDLNRLVTWLDWSVWVKCNPDCGPEEMCYLPTWPVGFPQMGYSPDEKPPFPSDPDKPYSSFDSPTTIFENLAEDKGIIIPGSAEWLRPQPTCIKRITPHKF